MLVCGSGVPVVAYHLDVAAVGRLEMVEDGEALDARAGAPRGFLMLRHDDLLARDRLTAWPCHPDLELCAGVERHGEAGPAVASDAGDRHERGVVRMREGETVRRRRESAEDDFTVLVCGFHLRDAGWFGARVARHERDLSPADGRAVLGGHRDLKDSRGYGAGRFLHAPLLHRGGHVGADRRLYRQRLLIVRSRFL